MIVSEVMTTSLVTVTPGDTLSHAANLLRQYQFHHLPVVSAASKKETLGRGQRTPDSLPVLEALLTSSDIDLAAAVGRESSSDLLHRPWQERHVAEVMHPATISVTPTTNLAPPPQILDDPRPNAFPMV